MTCREKLKMEHPENVSPDHEAGCFGCPSTYGYMDDDRSLCADGDACTECWDREIPGTEKINENETETKNMTTRKTKTELLEEIERKNDEIRELKKQVEKDERYAGYDDAAAEIKAVQDSFVKAGFSEDQAFAMINNLIGTISIPRK